MTALPAHIRDLIVDGAKQHPRSQQRRVGPSEVGTSCDRRLAYGLLEAPKCNTNQDPLPSVVGTGMHAQLEELAARANLRLGWPRFLLERRVEVRPGLTGSCDLYDVQEAQVIDWKGVSASRLKHYRDHGPSNTYRTQAHLYGCGYLRAGFPVTSVAIAFLPRGGWLRDAHWWTEPYDAAVVDGALARIDDLLVKLVDLQADEHPERVRDGWTIYGHQIAPAIDTADDCFFCAWHSRAPAGPFQCPGAATRAPDAITRLTTT